MAINSKPGSKGADPPGFTASFTRAEENFWFLLEALPDAMVASDRQGRILASNEKMEELFGYSKEELFGQAIENLVPLHLRGRDQEFHKEYRAQVRMRTMDRRLNLVGLRKNGITFPFTVDLNVVEVRGEPVVWSRIRATSEGRPEGPQGASASESVGAVVSSPDDRQLQLAMDAGGIATFDWDLRTGEIVLGGHQRLLGFQSGEFDRNYASLEKRVYPEDLAALNHAIAASRGTHSTFVHDFRVVWPDETVHWVRGRGEFIYDQSGQPVRMCGVAFDVDEHKLNERALQKAWERFRTAVDSMLEGCVLIDYSWTFLYANEAAATHALRDRASLIGRTMLEVYPGIETSKIFAYYRRSMEERCPQHFEEAFQFPGGDTRWFEMSVVPVPEGIFVLSLDVTGRRQAEKELRKSEERLRQAVRVSGTGIFDHDHSSDFVYWSPEQYAIYDWEPGTPVTVARYLERVHPDDRQRITEAVRRAHDPAGDGFYDVEHRLVRPDGSVRWTNIRSQTFFEGEGTNRHPVRTVGAATDITERKQAEADKAKLEAQLSQAQNMDSIGRLAGGVAHDFNNLLTVINGYTDLLTQRVGVDNALQKPLNEIKKAGTRAADLTQQLLAFGRRQVTLPKVLNLNHVVRDVESLLRRVIGEDIVLVTQLSADLGHVRADPGQVYQILMNLAANGRDAMPRGGRLTIETTNINLTEGDASEYPEAIPGPYVQLTVSDSGAGMDAETRAHLFEPFFTTKKVGEGTGLGLATVYGAVKQADGFIRVYSEPEKGARFSIYLHRVEELAETGNAKGAVPGKLEGSETILLVEDQPELRELAKTILTTYGYEVLEAGNGDEALHRSACWPGEIHLMVTDVVMPGMSGWELSNRMKPLRPAMKVIYMSGYAAGATLRELQEAGIDFLPKPLSPDDLVSKVREVLGRRP